MKKILSCILVLVMLLAMVTACGNRDNNQNDDTPTLTEAVNYFHNIYKDKSASTVTDFDVVGQVMLKGVRFTVTWTSSDDRVTIKESSTSGFYTVDLPDVNDAEFSYTLTATISDPDGNSEQKSYNFTMLAVDNSAVVTEPVANVAYKIFLVQSSYGQRLFALNTTQNNENKFINTSNDPKTAADFYAEAAEGGYKFSTEIDGVKNYLYAKTTVDESTGKVSKYIGYSATESTVFTYNSSIGGVWTTLIGGVSYGVGTYGEYKTICLSEATYYSTSTVGTTQFVMSLMTSEYAETLAPEEEVVVTEPANGSTLTIPEANELGEKFAHGLYSKGKFYVTGTVKDIENTQYGNMYIEDENGNTLYVYGVYDADGTNGYDAMDPQPAVGDTVKLYGIIGYYTDKAQMKNACLVELNGQAIGGGTQGGETGDSYGLVTELKTGDKVVIGAPAYGKLLSMVKTGNYNVGVDYSATDFSKVTNDEIFVVTVNDDGTYTFTSLSGKVLAMQDSYSSLSDTGANNKWEVTAKSGAAEGIFLVKNTVRGNYIEWYNQYSNWSSYTDPSDNQYEISFYLVEAGETPVDPAPHEHNFVNGECACGEKDPNYVPPTIDPDTPTTGEVVFDFGANGTAGTHTDGNDIGTEKTYTSGSYELVLTDAYKAYDGGFDMAGNSILKFGTGSVAGTVTFVVPDDVKSVIIYAARYKSYTDNNIIVVNGTSYNLTKNSDDGEYEAITVDTTTNKTVTVASSTAAAKPRCVVDKIVWVIGEGSGETPVDPAPHEHNFVNGECECGEKDPNYVPPTVESTYPVVNELHNGDKIIIGAPAYNKLLSMVKVATYYNKGVDYTLTNFSNVTNDEIFVVTVNEDGTYEFVSVSGQVLAIGTYSSLDVTGANTTWTIEPKAGADGIFYLKNVGRGNYLEWYASMDNWSTYNGSLSDMFELSFYLVEAGETPVDPAPHEHNFVNGECACGEKDPNYVAPDPATVNEADFDTIVTSNANGGDSTYTNTYTTTAGWTTVNSAIQTGGASVSNPAFPVVGSDNTHKAVCLNGKTSAPGKLTSSTLTGGISKLNLAYTKMFTDTELSVTITITDLTTGNTYSKVVSKTADKDTKYEVWTFEWTLETPITGDFTIEIVNNCPTGQDGNKDRITILSLTWED